MASLERTAAAVKAHNILATKGYTRSVSDPTLFASGGNQVRVPDNVIGLAVKVKNSNNSETLLMTFRLLDDTEADLTNNT